MDLSQMVDEIIENFRNGEADILWRNGLSGCPYSNRIIDNYTFYTKCPDDENARLMLIRAYQDWERMGKKEKRGEESCGCSDSATLCEYCTKPKVFFFTSTPYGTIQSFIKPEGTLDMDYPGGMIAKRLNYCPICGRKFREEDNHAK